MDVDPPPPPAVPPRPDLHRLVEDLTATAALFAECHARGRRLDPTLAPLRLLGARFLSGDPTDVAAAALRANPWPLAPIVEQPQLRVLDGAVRLSTFLAAIAAAGAPMAPSQPDGWDWEAGLAWLVLHGIPAHGLWSFVPSWFVADLLRPSLRRGGHAVSPLLLLLLRACPDLAAALPPPDAADFAARFEAWLTTTGVVRFGLFWVCTRAQLVAAAGAAASPPADDLVWPDPAAPVALDPAAAADGAVALPARSSLGGYGGFGAAFPALRVDLGEARAAAGTPWRLAAPTEATRTAAAAPRALELTAPEGTVLLPPGWLPPGMLLLDLALPAALAPSLAPLVRLRIGLDGEPIGERSGTALPGQRLHLLVPRSTKTATPVLEICLGCRPEAFALVARGGGVFARLRGLHYWRLR